MRHRWSFRATNFGGNRWDEGRIHVLLSTKDADEAVFETTIMVSARLCQAKSLADIVDMIEGTRKFSCLSINRYDSRWTVTSHGTTIIFHYILTSTEALRSVGTRFCPDGRDRGKETFMPYISVGKENSGSIDLYYE